MYFDYMMQKDTWKPDEVTSFLKLPVYTRKGIYVGHVKNVFLELDEKRVGSLLVTNTNPSLVEGSVDVAVPYRWVNAVGDIIILSNFPGKITTRKEKGSEKTKKAQEEEQKIDMIE
jgi:sporulation protein YlmC with PRC-barrel domain